MGAAPAFRTAVQLAYPPEGARFTGGFGFGFGFGFAAGLATYTELLAAETFEWFLRATLTRALIFLPRSAVTTLYVRLLVALIFMPFLYHWYEYVLGRGDQVPFETLSMDPDFAFPLIFGEDLRTILPGEILVAAVVDEAEWYPEREARTVALIFFPMSIDDIFKVLLVAPLILFPFRYHWYAYADGEAEYLPADTFNVCPYAFCPVIDARLVFLIVDFETLTWVEVKDLLLYPVFVRVTRDWMRFPTSAAVSL